jgi:hypothetical protein
MPGVTICLPVLCLQRRFHSDKFCRDYALEWFTAKNDGSGRFFKARSLVNYKHNASKSVARGYAKQHISFTCIRLQNSFSLVDCGH